MRAREGARRKLLDSRRLGALGWSAKRPLEVGLAQTYAWFLAKGLSLPQETTAFGTAHAV